MDEFYDITAVQELTTILAEFQKMLSKQPVLILTRGNCYYSIIPQLTDDDWINPDLLWKQYVYFCADLNTTELVFMYR